MMIAWLVFTFIAVAVAIYGWELLKRLDQWLAK